MVFVYLSSLRKRGDYFSKKGYEFVVSKRQDYDLPNNLKFKGFIDLIVKTTSKSNQDY